MSVIWINVTHVLHIIHHIIKARRSRRCDEIPNERWVDWLITKRLKDERRTERNTHYICLQLTRERRSLFPEWRIYLCNCFPHFWEGGVLKSTCNASFIIDFWVPYNFLTFKKRIINKKYSHVQRWVPIVRTLWTNADAILISTILNCFGKDKHIVWH